MRRQPKCSSDGGGSQANNKAVHRARLQLPKWFSQKVWDLTVQVSTFGWQTNLVTFNIVPNDSLVFQYAEDGDLCGIRSLFSQGLASPLDCDEDGNPLIKVSLGAVHVQTVVD